MNREKRKKAIALCWLLAAALFPAWLWLPSSTTVFVHVAGDAGSRAETSAPLPFPPFLVSTTDGCRAYPVRYGPKYVEVRFADGKRVHATFFNADVGRVRRMDIFIERQGDLVSFRQVVNEQMVVFTGYVRASDTSREKPFQLNWI